MDGYEGTPTTVGINTFSADVIQSTKFSAGIATVRLCLVESARLLLRTLLSLELL